MTRFYIGKLSRKGTGYGVWVIDANSLQTNLGNPKTYVLLGNMG